MYLSAGMAGATWNCSHLGASYVYTIQPCTMSLHAKPHTCLAVTCHLHFWQNDRDLLHATAVTRGWNGYRNQSQHRKSTLEKKILPPLLQGFEPGTFQSRVRRSNHWAIPVPSTSYQQSNSGTLFPQILFEPWPYLQIYTVKVWMKRQMQIRITDLSCRS